MASKYPVILEALDASKPTLTATQTGVLCSAQDTKKLYYWTGTGWTQIALATSGYKASFDNPPSSPSAYDDEFATGTLDAKWTVSSTGTTNPIASGTVNPIASLTTPVYDLSTMPSWLLVQSDNSSAQVIKFTQSVTLGSDATFFVKFSANHKVYSATNEGQLELSLGNSSDSNESVVMYANNNTGAGFRPHLLVNNNGSLTSSTGPNWTEGTPLSDFYAVIWKSGNNYWGGMSCGMGLFTTYGPLTKTGVTTFDEVRLVARTSDETPSGIGGFDFFRYYPSITYALMN